ncbi:MAG TPA: VVA0879 family protein [Bacillus sp. (in: firmicutes)]|uniref:VVA0879 family protein n=1 Tax=Laceyella tengchongensis TaxID=574699 RepID=UPI000F4F6CD8|nr:VVA0879 family protein [Laceyella tengchongensis]HWO76250.1 VVA0879 family protein [Bacillus sp. (in: firmicutes)]
MIRQTDEEWYREMLDRYRNLKKVTFECPNCGHLQSIEDFVTLGLDATRAYRDCLGRYVDNLDCQFSVDDGDCSFDNVRIIVLKDGSECKVFNFI